MTRYLLDTSILSNSVTPQPSAFLLAWWAEQRDADLFISTLTLAEIRKAWAACLQKTRVRPCTTPKEPDFSQPSG